MKDTVRVPVTLTSISDASKLSNHWCRQRGIRKDLFKKPKKKKLNK